MELINSIGRIYTSVSKRPDLSLVCFRFVLGSATQHVDTHCIVKVSVVRVISIIEVTGGYDVAHNDFIATLETVTIGVAEFDPDCTVLGIAFSLIRIMCGRCTAFNGFNDYQEHSILNLGLPDLSGELCIRIHKLRKIS